MLINISDEMFRNLKREPLVLPDGRKFLILEASMSAYGVPVDAVPDENGALPVYELGFDASIVDEPVVWDEGTGRNYLTLSGRVVEVDREDSISADIVKNARIGVE